MITIGNGRLSAAINPLGAELTHLHDADARELMTNADPAFWTGHAPILFPIVGAVNGDVIHVDGCDYPMKKHGFARHSRFEVVVHEAAAARFRLVDTPETRAHYPVAFALDVAFVLDGATLTVTATIANPGDAPLPTSFGFHPALAWPLPYGAPRSAHRIAFAETELAQLRVLTADGLIAPDTRPSPLVDERILPLADDLFTDDALIWDRVHSSSVRYGAAAGPHLEIAFPDTPMLGIWTKPGAAYICIEPWHGIADPTGFTGDFRDKPGVFEVPAGSERSCTMAITLMA